MGSKKVRRREFRLVVTLLWIYVTCVCCLCCVLYLLPFLRPSSLGLLSLRTLLSALLVLPQTSIEIDHAVLGPACPDKLIQLDLYRQTVTVLAIMDDKDHHKRNDGCASVDDSLPSLGVIKKRTAKPQATSERKATLNANGLPAKWATAFAKLANAWLTRCSIALWLFFHKRSP